MCKYTEEETQHYPAIKPSGTVWTGDKILHPRHAGMPVACLPFSSASIRPLLLCLICRWNSFAPLSLCVIERKAATVDINTYIYTGLSWYIDLTAIWSAPCVRTYRHTPQGQLWGAINMVIHECVGTCSDGSISICLDSGKSGTYYLGQFCVSENVAIRDHFRRRRRAFPRKL